MRYNTTKYDFFSSEPSEGAEICTHPNVTEAAGGGVTCNDCNQTFVATVDNVPYAAFADALEAIRSSNDKVLKMYTDYAYGTTVLNSNNLKYSKLTIDLNGHRVYGAEDSSKLIQVKNADSTAAGEKIGTVIVSFNGENGKIRLTWTKSKGYKVDLFEIYRSVKKNSGYGKNAFFTTKSGSTAKYLNTKNLKKGKTYYYKLRGVRVIDGRKYYTKWSNKTWKTVK